MNERQIYAGIAALRWTRQDLADHANIGLATVHRVLAGQAVSSETRAKITAAFSAHGVTFKATRNGWTMTVRKEAGG